MSYLFPTHCRTLDRYLSETRKRTRKPRSLNVKKQNDPLQKALSEIASKDLFFWVSSRTDQHDDVVDVTSFSALDEVERQICLLGEKLYIFHERVGCLRDGSQPSKW